VGQAEVEQLHPAVLADEDVGGFQVPVQNSTRVRVRQPLRHLLRDSQGLGHVDRPLLDPPCQRLASQQFHDEVGTGVARPHVEERHDAGVVEASHRLGLLLDPVGRQVAARSGEPQRLNRHDPVQLRVERLVDRAEAATSHLAPDLEPAHPVPGLKFLLPAFEKVRTGGLEDLLEESGERAGVTGARFDSAVALLVASRQDEPPRTARWRKAT